MTPQERYAMRRSVLKRYAWEYADKIGLRGWTKGLLECDIGIAMAYGTPIVQAIRNIKRAADSMKGFRV